MGAITGFVWVLGNGHEPGHYNNNSHKKLAIRKELFVIMHFNTRIAGRGKGLTEMEWSG